MDVAFVITELEPGGAERCLVNLALGLRRRGHCISVISIAPEPCSDRDELVIKLRKNDIEPHFLEARNYRQFFHAKRRLSQLLDKLSPDIVQSFLFHANVLCGEVSKRLSFKLIAGLRVSDPRRFRHWIMRYQHARFQRAVCVSDDVASYAKRQLGFQNDLLSVIPNGIDIAAFDMISPVKPEKLSFGTIPPLLTFIGRLHLQKGVDLIAANAESILQACPQHHIAIVGDGPSKQSMQRCINDVGLQQRVHFYGYREDAASILKASQLLLFPSRWEGMPNVVMEAMAAKKPIVACPADGIRALLSHAPRQISRRDDWAATVIDLALDSEACDNIGEANYTEVTKTYQLSQMIIRYEDLYSQLLQPS